MKSKSPFLNKGSLLSKSPFASKSPLLSKSPFLQAQQTQMPSGVGGMSTNTTYYDENETNDETSAPLPPPSETPPSPPQTNSNNMPQSNSSATSGSSEGAYQPTMADMAAFAGQTKEEYMAENPDWEQTGLSETEIRTQAAMDAADAEAMQAGGYEAGTSSGLDDEMLATQAGQTGNANLQVLTANEGVGTNANTTATDGGSNQFASATDADELASQEVASGAVADAAAAGTLENPTNPNSGTVLATAGVGGNPAVGTGSGPASGNNQNAYQSDPTVSATGNVNQAEAQTVSNVTTEIETAQLEQLGAEGGDPDGILQDSHANTVAAEVAADAAEGTSSTSETNTQTYEQYVTPTSAPVEEDVPPSAPNNPVPNNPVDPIVTTSTETGGAPTGGANLPGSMGGEDMKCGNYQGDGGLYADAGLDAQAAEPEEIEEANIETATV